MREITRLTLQKRDQERVNVYLDGAFAFGLALSEAIHLKVGQQLSDDDIARLQQEDGYQRGYHRALDYLSRRPRSRAEIMNYLAKKDIPESHRERIVQRLADLGYVDDLAFAKYWIENREAFRPRGVRAIRYELRQKGVDEKIIDKALALAEIDEMESAFRIALKQLPRIRGIEDRWQFQQKLAGYLGRRGFGWATISEVSERLWQMRDEEIADS